jgi:hypothetical protein
VGLPRTWRPPGDYLGAVLPGLVVFGLGIMVVVAPLTTALMNSVPEARAGVASAVNNALSRVGPQLAIALPFLAVTSSFYTSLADQLGVEARPATETRQVYSPLNAPVGEVTARELAAARTASGEAFRLAMLVAAGLAGAGAVINGVGIRNPPRELTPRRPVECLPGTTAP